MATDNPQLSFLIDLNIDDLKSKTEVCKKKFEELGRHAEKEGAYIDALFQHLGKGFDVSTIEGKMNALRSAITENSLTLKQWGDNVELWSRQADKAFAKGDFDLFNTINKDIVQTKGEMSKLEAETTYLTQLLKKMEESIGQVSQPAASAPRLFTTEEDYQHVKDLEQAIDELRGKLANAGTDTEFTNINGQIIELQKELDGANASATAAAAALGDNLGTKAAEASSNLYELNERLAEQHKAYDDLCKKLEETAEKIDAAQASGDASQLKDLQIEYQHLAEQVENANNALAKTEGEQKDASDSWENLLDAIGGAGEAVAGSTRPVSGAITSFSQLASVFKESSNPVAAFRSVLQALRGGMNLTQVSVKGLMGGLKKLWATMLSNPLTALLVALAAIVTAIVKLVQSMETEAEKQKRLNELQENYLELLQQTAEHHNEKTKDAIKDKERELSLSKSANQSLQEQYKIEDELYALKREKAVKDAAYYAEEIENIQSNRNELFELEQQLVRIKNAKAGGEDGKVTITIDGKTSKQKIDEAIENLQASIKNKELQIKLGVDARDELAEVQAEQERIKNERKDKAKQTASTERSTIRETQQLRISLERDAYKRDIEQEKANAENKIADLKRRLREEANLTKAARNSINEQIKLQQQKLNNDLEVLEVQHQQKLLNIRRQIEDVGIDSGAKTATEQRASLLREYKRLYEDVSNQISTGILEGSLSNSEIEELFKLLEAYKRRYSAESAILNLQLQQQELETERETIMLRLDAVRQGSLEELRLRMELIEAERKAELNANKLLPEDQRQSESDINAKYNKQREEEEKAFYASMIGEYANYQQEMLDMTAAYENKRAELELQISQENDPKKKQALRQSLANLERTYKTSLKNLQTEFLKYNLGDVFNEQTVQNIKEAKRILDEMANMSIEEFNLAYNAQLTAEQFEELKERIREVKNELRDMGKGYSLKEAFSDAFSGKTKEEVQRGVDYIVNGFNKVSSVANGVASAMRAFADATGDAKLEQMADTFQNIADTISTAGGYAAAGAQIGGGWGAVIGAVLGIGQGILTSVIKTNAQREEEEKQRAEEAHNYLDEVINGIGSVIGSINNLNSTVTSLNYVGYQKELLASISALREDANYNSHDNWHNLYDSVSASNVIRSGVLNDDQIRNVFSEFMSRLYANTGNWLFGEGVSDLIDEIADHYNTNTVEGMRKLLEDYYSGAFEDWIDSFFSGWGGGWTVSFIMGNLEYEDILDDSVREAYANQENNKDYILDQRRLKLIEEMNALLKSGNLDTIAYFNTQLKVEQLSIDMLKRRKKELEEAGKSTIEIDNQIAEAEFNMRERVREMFEGLAGTDLNSIVSKWLDIFKEFGNDFDSAIEKINESINDMIRNMFIQTLFVQPLMERLKGYINNYAKDSHLEKDEYGNYIWTNEAFIGMAEGLRGFIGGAKEDFIGLQNMLNELGIGWSVSENERSASAKGIATASQESVDYNNGVVTSIQGHTFIISENSSVIRDCSTSIRDNSNIIRDNVSAILGSVRQIETNTAHLNRIDNDIHNIQVVITGIETQGLRLRNS